MTEPGEPFDIKWRVLMLGNAAEQPFYHIDVEVFLHRWPEDDDLSPGEWCILTTQDWIEDHPNDIGTGAECAGYVRSYVDGTIVDPDDPFAHDLVDPPEAASG